MFSPSLWLYWVASESSLRYILHTQGARHSLEGYALSNFKTRIGERHSCSALWIECSHALVLALTYNMMEMSRRLMSGKIEPQVPRHLPPPREGCRESKMGRAGLGVQGRPVVLNQSQLLDCLIEISWWSLFCWHVCSLCSGAGRFDSCPHLPLSRWPCRTPMVNSLATTGVYVWQSRGMAEQQISSNQWMWWGSVSIRLATLTMPLISAGALRGTSTSCCPFGSSDELDVVWMDGLVAAFASPSQCWTKGTQSQRSRCQWRRPWSRCAAFCSIAWYWYWSINI